MLDTETERKLKEEHEMHLLGTPSKPSFEWLHPAKLDEEHLKIVAKRCGLNADDSYGARAQYYTLYRNRTNRNVIVEMDRLHTQFIALRLKRSAL